MRLPVVVVGCLLVLAGCGAPAVSVDVPEPSGRAAALCRDLATVLPPTVLGESPRQVQPASPFVAAWGDPPISLRCGVPKPAALRPTSPCTEVNGVGWFAEPAAHGYLFTTVDRAVHVEVAVPSAYAQPSSALVDLASAVKRTLPVVRPCQ